MIQSENPKIRPVGDLLNENFFIPRYQRGYRWGEQEITELLDDILNYYNRTQDRENPVSKFYCLQPIVVKRRAWKDKTDQAIDGWELIDGQQRITTIFIILQYLEDVRQLVTGKSEIYSLDFETRENCYLFFNSKEFKLKVNESNVDFYHISMAYQYVKKWFDENGHKVEILNTLLKNEYNTSVIWYEAFADSIANTDDTSIDLFTRLNEGKIPLTDAELIKALLLQADFYPKKDASLIRQRLFEIASEWDEIESSLGDEKMWFFINDTSYQPSSKIELIFKLLAEQWNGFNEQRLVSYESTKPKHFEFIVFDRFLAQKRKSIGINTKDGLDLLIPVNEVWRDVKNIYSSLREWFEDHTLFHYLGYLLVFEKKKEAFIQKMISSRRNKNEFLKDIKVQIANSVFIKGKKASSSESKTIGEITYGENNNEIIRILLLFNIESLIEQKKEESRFPFHLYKKENITSLEHIHPQNPEGIDNHEERSQIWLDSHSRSLSLLKPKDETQKQRLDILLSRISILHNQFNKEEFKIVYNDVIQLYSELSEIDETEIHTIHNLALVDMDTNSQLNNSFFDVKREILKENKGGRYIPVCTQRVFSKYYSKSSTDMIFWNQADRSAYFTAIKKVYDSYIELLK